MSKCSQVLICNYCKIVPNLSYKARAILFKKTSLCSKNLEPRRESVFLRPEFMRRFYPLSVSETEEKSSKTLNSKLRMLSLHEEEDSL